MSNDLDETLNFATQEYHPNFISTLKIKNFKSVKSINLKNKRVNVFIGEPNTGKSNILEALGLISAIGHRQLIRNFVRTTSYSLLFHNEFLDHNVEISLKNWNSDLNHKYSSNVEIRYEEGKYNLYLNNLKKGILTDYYPSNPSNGLNYDNSIPYGAGRHSMTDPEDSYAEFYSLDVDESKLNSLKYYKFRDFDPVNYRPLSKNLWEDQIQINDDPKIIERIRAFTAAQEEIMRRDVLDPPYGKNIFFVVNNTEKNQLIMKDLLADFGFKLRLRKGAKQLEVQREQDEIVTSFPLYLLADTIQTVIFYLIAFSSNKNSVIILEEPEAHTFPFYTRLIGETIATDDNNQYFIATHNPYFLDAIIEKTPKDDIQINIVQSKNGETIVHQLTESQLKLLYKGDTFATLAHFDDWPE